MSDLVVTYAGLKVPADRCSQDPPEPTKKDPNPPDDCQIVIPLRDKDEKNGSVHSIRFDRKGKTFVLSQKNSTQDLTWIGNRGGATKIIDMARMVETVMRALGNGIDKEYYAILLTLTQYVVTGRIRFQENMQYNPEIPGGEGDVAQMASYLLEVFTHNSDRSAQKLMGALRIFGGESGGSKEVSERISWVSEVLGLRSAYLAFRFHFLGDVKPNEIFGSLKENQKKNLARLIQFCRQVVIRAWMSEPFRFDRSFLDAYLGYATIPLASLEKEKGDFCTRLDKAIVELGLIPEPEFKADCRLAAKYLSLDAKTATSQSLREAFLDAGGQALLQQLVNHESERSNMKVEWLHSRGRLTQVLEAVLKNLKVEIPEGKDSLPVLSLDVTGIKLGLDLLIGKNLTHRREYILASLAVLRRFLDDNGNPLNFRIFSGGRFVEISADLTYGTKDEFQNVQKALESRLQTSEIRSERVLPIVELLTCVLGVGGIVASEVIDPISEGAWQFRVGIGSSALAGAGCSALLGHYVLPKIGKVRNRYLWEGITGISGFLVGAGIYFAVKGFGSSSGDRGRFPTDEYGP